MLQNMRVGLPQLEETAKWSRDNSIRDYEQAAIHYPNANEDLIKSWMPQENYGKVFRALRELERSSR